MILSQILQIDTLKVLSVNPPMTFEESLSDPSMIIAGFAILLSVFGLVFTVTHSRKTIKLTEKHNKLSVRPLLDIYSDYSIQDCISLSLKNSGLGTAILKSFVINFKEKKYKHMIDLLNSECIPYEMKNTTIESFDSGYSLATNSKIEICRVYFKTFEHKCNFFQILKCITIEYEFETMYGEKLNQCDTVVSQALQNTNQCCFLN